MSLVVNISVGRLLSRNERLNTAKINAMVKGIVIDISGSVGTADLAPGAVTPDKVTAGAYWYANALFDGSTTYTAIYAPVITAYTDGMVLAFKADTLNPGTCSFDAGGGAKPLMKHGGLRVLDPGDIVADGIVDVRFNGTLIAGGCWEVLSLVGRPVETQPFVPASAYMAGQEGLFPAPVAGQQARYAKADGTWGDPVGDAVTQLNGLNTYTEVFKAQNFI